MATGNLAFQIQKSANNDLLYELAILLNQVAAAMHQAVLDSSHLIPDYTYQSLL